MSSLPISRDYSNKTIPTLIKERQWETYYNWNKIKILEKWYFDNTKYSIWSAPYWYQKTQTKTLLTSPVLWNSNFWITFITPLAVNNSDAIEMFVKFKNNIPKTLRLAINNYNWTINKWSRMDIWQQLNGEETEWWKKTKNIWNLDDVELDNWYKVIIPLSYNEIASAPLNKIYLDIFANNWENPILEVWDVSVLREYSKSQGNNIKVSFDVEAWSNTNELEVALSNSVWWDYWFWWYKVLFSKSWNETCLYKKNQLLWSCVANSESKFNPSISKYNMSFVKTNDKISFVVSYNYPEDWVIKKKVVTLINATDTTPINIKEAKLFFKTTNWIHKISNIKIEDWEDLEPANIVYVKMDAWSYNNYWKIRLFNEDWSISEKLFPVIPWQLDYYISIWYQPNYEKRLIDIEVIPNWTTERNVFKIYEISLVKESETPLVITKQDKSDLLGTTVIRKWSKIVSVFKNTKEKIMWYSIFLRKVQNWSFTEWLTLKMYKVLPSWEVDYTNLITEKTVTTDSLDNVNTKQLKITFPAVAVVKNDYYAIELSTENNNGYYIYWTNKNEFIDWYSYNLKEEHPEQEWWEFNNLWLTVPWTKWTNWYLWTNPLSPVNAPSRYTISWDNMWINAEKSLNQTVTIPYTPNTDFKTRYTFIVKWEFPKWNNGWPLIIQKQNWSWRSYWLYLDNNLKWNVDKNSLHFTFWQQWITWQCAISTWNEDFEWAHTIAVSVDTITWIIKVYKDWIRTDEFEIWASNNITAVKYGWWTAQLSHCQKWRLIVQTNANTQIIWQHSQWTDNNMKLDYLRIYDDVLSDTQIQLMSNPTSEFKYRLPHDIWLYILSKNSDIETLDERTYDLWEWIVREIDWDLYLDWYNSWNWYKELLMKWNITFHVKWNIYINADRLYVLNDNNKQWNTSISYIWFIADKDIIIWPNVTHLEWWYYAKWAIKTLPSEKQLKVKWLFSANEVDLQNRTYMWTNFNPNDWTWQEDSVIMEFDNRIYKRMPPLFYQSNDKKWIEIKED